ncbi:hypothetical protein CEQ90_11300 [Lewinellaceae bacterium SD302]|nr:hypothetical protein CEQ90_11300 [Lewinellaceae bacterium SD302]
MFTMRKLFLLLVLSVSLTGGLFAQQYGHLNFGELLSSMPATETAEKQLQEYNDQLVAEGEKMAAALDAGIKDFKAKEVSGDYTPRQLEEMRNKLGQDQQALMLFEREAQNKLNKKRSELLEPVVTLANEAVEAVAKANGMKLIFDTSVFNAVLFADESKDVLNLVKKELGIAEE